MAGSSGRGVVGSGRFLMDYSAEKYQIAVNEIAFSCNLPQLGPFTQDWEFEVADSSKLNILIEKYNELATNRLRREILAHLLIGSYNDAIVNGTATVEIWDVIESLLIQKCHELAEILEYWACKNDQPEDRFNVSEYVISFDERIKQEWQ